MLDIIIHYALPFIALIDAIVFIHIAGHFIWCRCFSIKLQVVSFGIGPAVIKFTKGETVWKIGCLPIGGYVSPRFNQYSAGKNFQYVGAALSGIMANILCASFVAFFIFVTYGFPVIENNEFHLTQLSCYNSFIMTLRFIPLTWTNWNTSSWGWVLSSYRDVAVRLAFLGAIWSSQLAILNLIPYPRLDAWEILKIIVLRTVGETMSPITLLYINRCMIAIIIIVLLFLDRSWGHVSLPSGVESVRF